MTRAISWRVGAGIVAIFWALIAWTYFPAPFIDDAWYIGAAMNLVQHGEFSNPLCESLATVGSKQLFLASMPFHDYVLAGWLWLFGISALSFHVLYTLLAFLVAALIYRLLPSSRTSWLAAIFVCLATFGLFGGAGLRQDSLGIFLVLLGFDTWRARNPLGYFWRNLCLALAVITFPTAGMIGMIMSTAGLVHRAMYPSERPGSWAGVFVATALAYLFGFFVYLACIHGQLFAALTSLAQNQKLTVLEIRHRFQFFTTLGICKWVVPQAAFLVLLAWQASAARRSRQAERLYFCGVALVVFLVLAYASGNSSTGAHVWAFVCLMGGLAILLDRNLGAVAWTFYAVAFALAAYGHAHVAIQNSLADAPISRQRAETLAGEIRAMRPSRLYLDAYALREVYDYKLPDNAYCFETSRNDGWALPLRADELRADSVSLVSVGSAFPTQRSPAAGQNARPLIVFGHVLNGVVRNPYDLDILDNRTGESAPAPPSP